MKKALTITILSALIISCSSKEEQSIEAIIASGDTKKIEAKRQELKVKQQTIIDELHLIEKAIAKNNSGEKVPLITTTKIHDTLFVHYLSIQGNVATKQNIVIYPEFNGLLTKVYVKEGQKVKKGQLLAKIDDGGMAQQLSQLEAEAALSKVTYERRKSLWDQKIGSEIEYLQAETAYKANSNAVAHLRKQLSKTNVTAPFSGVIDDVLTEEGTVVAPGQSELMRIVNLDNMYIEAEIPENHIKNVKKGKAVEVTFPVLGKTIETKVRQVGNYINPNNRSFKIEVDVPNKDGDIKPNLTSKLLVNDYTNDKSILIPQSIISENAMGQQYVFVIKDKQEDNKATAQKAIITTGLTQGDVIEVLSGLSDGDEVIIEGARNVNDQQQVKIINL